MTQNILVGADPEVFVVREGIVVPVCGMLNAGKWTPLPVDRGTILEDNVLAEFGMTPAATAEEFADTLMHVMAQLNEALSLRGATSLIKASHVFDMAELLPHPQAMEFGCEPDFNAWEDGGVNPRPSAANQALRSAGGHVHIGFASSETTMSERIKVIQACDVLLGLPSVLADSDTQRRELYGKAGAFRPKEYGAEYRTLSNFWLQSRELMQSVFERAVAAVSLSKNNDMAQMLETCGGLIQTAINTGNVGLSRELMQEFGVEAF